MLTSAHCLKASLIILKYKSADSDFFDFLWNNFAQKMTFSIKDFFSKCEIYSHLLKKSLMKNVIFWALLFARIAFTDRIF